MNKAEAKQKLEELDKNLKSYSESISVERGKLQKIIDHADDTKSFNDVCVESGTTEHEFNEKYKDYTEDTKAYEMLKMICKVFNEGWTPDWNNSNELKYYPWFKMGAGFRFSATLHFYSHASALSASCLYFKDAKTAEHVGRTFLEIYRKYLC